MKTTRKYLALLFAVAFATALICLAPLRTALELNVCEGYELMKGLLFSIGKAGAMWNDQPPFHTSLLGILFRLFGPSAYVARLLQVAFAALLVWSLFKVMQEHSGLLGAAGGTILLVSTPPFIQLSCAVMLELPAMALAITSLLAWRRYVAGRSNLWLAASGSLMGFALQTKLTAALFLPVFLMEYLVWCSKAPIRLSEDNAERQPGARFINLKRQDVKSGIGRNLSRPPIIWLVSILTVVGLVYWISSERWDVFGNRIFPPERVLRMLIPVLTPADCYMRLRPCFLLLLG